ncbi:hypothetical protein AUC31_11555 [Planococcus rifietoensis]|uniref:Uncharacterized protein n=1 Tax=Planococcus rifietoensis TaxID=200991 RepID=A0A0U2XI13_9BACL|nr:hypothetical protein AUC31_11555 [Planococcus rifietoensis]
MYIAIIIAIIYCVVLWMLRNLGKFRVPLFIYGLVVQLSFLVFFFRMSRYFRTSDSVNRDYYDIFVNGLVIFYLLMVVPFVVALWVQVYKGVWRLDIGKISKITMMALFVLMTLIFTFFGFYAHILFYYGFAP